MSSRAGGGRDLGEAGWSRSSASRASLHVRLVLTVTTSALWMSDTGCGQPRTVHGKVRAQVAVQLLLIPQEMFNDSQADLARERQGRATVS